MDLKFSDDQMRAIVTKAIIEGMGEEQRNLIVQKAIESLMKQANPQSYNDKRSVLEVSFEEAARQVLKRIAVEELEKPENDAKLRTLFAEVVEKTLGEGEGRVALRDALTRAMETGLSDKNRY